MKKNLFWIIIVLIVVWIGWFAQPDLSSADLTSTAIWLVWIAVASVVAMVAIATIITISRRRANSANTADDGHSKPEQGKKDHHKAESGHGHHGSSVKDKIVTAVIWVVSILVVMYLLVAAVHWLFGAGTLTNTRTGGIVRAAPPIAGSSSAKTVDPAPASDDCSLTLVDGVMPDWIKVPKGYAADINAEGQANIGMQCSFADDSPPKDADGPNYWCSGPKPIAPWFRPYIYQHAAATVTFHCHLRRIDL